MSEFEAVTPTAISGMPEKSIVRAASGAKERARRHAVNVAILIYLVIVLDGIVRKYIFPDFQRPLVFMRDPLILYLYFHCFANDLIKKSVFLGIAAALFLLTFVLVFPTSISSSGTILFPLFGLRQYFLAIPLAFIIADIFHNEDFQRFIRINLALVTLMAPLMVLQVLSPAGSWINAGGATDENLVFNNLNFGDYVRAPGFFTSAAATAAFLPFVGAMLLFAWSIPRRFRPCSDMVLMVATGGFTIAIACSGNRGAIVGLIIVALGGALSGFAMPGKKAFLRIALGSVALATVALLTFVFLFPDQFSALSERWAGANDIGDQGDFAIVIRAFGDFFAFIPVIPMVPILGAGLGMGSNAATILVTNPSAGLYAALTMVEADWSRHIVDLGPILGVFYIIFRVALTCRLAGVAFQGAVRYSDPRPYLVFLSVGIIVMDGLLTGQSTVNGLGWFYAGLILAAPNYRQSFS